MYRGHEGVREFFESLLEVLPDWRPELEESRTTATACS